MTTNPFTIAQTDQNRHVVANRLIKSGEVILTETPFVYGPKSGSPVLCLGCFECVDSKTYCTKCSWPVCGPECEALSSHKDNECEIFAKNCVKFQDVDDPYDVCLQYEGITPLRMLLAKEKDPKRWLEEIEGLESKNEIRKINTKIVDFVRNVCKLEFCDTLIHTICGILEVTAIDVRASSGYLIRCLYPKLSLISHNCVTNLFQTVTPNDFKITLRASVNIPENHELFYNYVYPLWPTLIRRDFLKENKYLDCQCRRCSDKTELGTHLSTLKCSKCDNGVILSTDPLNDSCDWNCTHCEFKTNAVSVRKVYKIVQSEIEAIQMVSGAEGIEQREAIFRKYRSVFHPKNAYMSILRVDLTQLYGRAPGYTIHELPDLLQEHKVELCYQLLEVLDVVEPGVSRLRGITLYELHAPLISLARNEYKSGLITREDFRRKMQDAVELLEKSVEILKWEPENSIEGELAIVAKQSLENLVQNFDLLIQTA
ncbi:SET domain-containing protein SmydA-8-like [Tribolium madens]|uniref:SET domain-containing protein SmydA-8-like n=1 Tax=Tribolium madens TaxID=41895 RepID=UPI001CF7394A|nr:SET domain-containing protein SmydA-8-like [Tribolium madens]